MMPSKKHDWTKLEAEDKLAIAMREEGIIPPPNIFF
jgi:hypothetical protein